MSAHPMTCTACERVIERGAEYVAVTRQTERVGRFGGITVVDAELDATYHPGCEPSKGRAS